MIPNTKPAIADPRLSSLLIPIIPKMMAIKPNINPNIKSPNMPKTKALSRSAKIF